MDDFDSIVLMVFVVSGGLLVALIVEPGFTLIVIGVILLIASFATAARDFFLGGNIIPAIFGLSGLFAVGFGGLINRTGDLLKEARSLRNDLRKAQSPSVIVADESERKIGKQLSSEIR